MGLSSIGWGLLAAFVVLLLAHFSLPSLRRQNMEQEVRRLVQLERELGKTHPQVKALRVKVWRYRLFGEGAGHQAR